MTERAQDLILVTGASGKTGRRVAERLTADGRAIRAVSRSTPVRFDWEEPSTWPAAVDGATAVYLAYAPDLAVPGAAATVEAFTRMAVAAGVRRIVLLSGRGEAAAEEAERVVAASGAEWTVVRAAWFQQNFSEGAFRDLVLGGEVALPVADVREPFVDVDDVAEVAVAALTQDGHAGRVHEVTGPRLMTFAEAVAELSTATGRALRYVPVPLGAFLDALRAEGLPEDAVGLLGLLFGELFDGRNAHLADGVRDALGRAPRDFADFARAAAADGAWDVEQVAR